MRTDLEKLESDLCNLDLPRDATAFDKIKCDLRIGAVVTWYYADELKFWKGEKLNPREMASNTGIIVPAHDVEIRGHILEPENCVVVQYDYACEKCYPESTWFALNRLLDNPEVVEIFESGK